MLSIASTFPYKYCSFRFNNIISVLRRQRYINATWSGASIYYIIYNSHTYHKIRRRAAKGSLHEIGYLNIFLRSPSYLYTFYFRAGVLLYGRLTATTSNALTVLNYNILPNIIFFYTFPRADVFDLFWTYRHV